MRLEFFVVSESVSIDQVTNELSVFNILESVASEGFPVLVPKCAAVSLWRVEPGDEGRDWQVMVRVTLPGQGPQDFTTNFQARPRSQRHRVMQRVHGLPLLQEGDLRFELLLNGQHAADHIVTVTREGGAGLRLGAPPPA